MHWTCDNRLSHIRRGILLTKYASIHGNQGDKEFFANLENSRNHNEHEIKSGYYGNNRNPFGLFTTCTFYSNHGVTEKIPITIITEAGEKSKITSVSFADLLSIYVSVWQRYISDVSATKFWSQYVLYMLTEIKKVANIAWHYFEAHRGNDPTDRADTPLKA